MGVSITSGLLDEGDLDITVSNELEADGGTAMKANVSHEQQMPAVRPRQPTQGSRQQFEETGYHFSSREEWKNYWRRTGNMRAGLTDAEEPLMRKKSSLYWMMQKEIRVERSPAIGQQVMQPVQRGIARMQAEVGIHALKVLPFGADKSANEELAQATYPDGKLSAVKLREIVSKEKLRDETQGGKQHADVIITEKPFENDGGVSRRDWGCTIHQEGVMILSLWGDRQNNLEFLENVSMHEAGHLFGFQAHHGQYKVNGYPDPATVRCVMSWESSTRNLCEQCRDALVAFWDGVEKKTGLDFSL